MVGGVFVNYFGAPATFRGIGMASLVILLIFSFIQFLSGDTEGKEDKMLAENIPVPSSPVPIATIDLVQSQSEVGSPVHQAAILPVKKTKHQEDQEDVTQPAWVLSGAPWVTIAFAIFQIKEMMKMKKSSGPPPEADPLQVLNDGASAETAATSQENSVHDGTDPPPDNSEPNTAHPDEDQTHPHSDRGGPRENPALTAENTD
nr:PREDICTED: major facilitator superfamily domain-containing protein 6-A-like [Paralichthys olivaceus]